MKKEHIEELKDAMVDHIFVSLKLEKQKIITTNAGQINIRGSGKSLKFDHLALQGVYAKSMKYGVLAREYFKLIDTSGSISVDPLFVKRLQIRGVPIIPTDINIIVDAQNTLLASGFLVSNLPFTDEIKLTPKGENHYEKGLSFKKDYLSNRMARRANSRSQWSLGIAIFGFLLSLLTVAIKFKSDDWKSLFSNSTNQPHKTSITHK